MMKEKKKINIEVGYRVRVHRERQGLTREQLAEMVGITPRFVADIERGTVGVSLTTLKRICENLGVTSDSILWDTIDTAHMTARISDLDREYQNFIDEMLIKQVELIKTVEAKTRMAEK